MQLRVLTYNVLDGGEGREPVILEVLQAAQPDVVILQEVYTEQFLQILAQALGLHALWGEGNRRRRVALLSRWPIRSAASDHPLPPIWRNVIQAQVEYQPGKLLAVTGVHPMANLGLVLEVWRWWEARHIVKLASAHHGLPGFIAGDFNAIAPGDFVEMATMPRWLKFMLWLQGGRTYPYSMQAYFKAGYVDAFRTMHPTEAGFTLPASRPNARLDYVLVNPALRPSLRECEVVREPAAAVTRASDHCPVLATLEL